MVKKSDSTFINGTVTEALPNTMFKVELDAMEKTVLCTLKGILRRRYVRIFPGDRVKVSVSLVDPTQGRITFRTRK